jgi:hypothetical protein
MPASDNQWTFETLLIHIKAMLDEAEKRTADRFAAQDKAVEKALAGQEKAVTAALASQEKAVAIAEENSKLWRQSANEWRGAMNDREGNFVKVGEYGLLLTQVKELRDAMSQSMGRGQGWASGWQILLGLAALVGVAVAMVVAFRGGHV